MYGITSLESILNALKTKILVFNIISHIFRMKDFQRKKLNYHDIFLQDEIYKTLKFRT